MSDRFHGVGVGVVLALLLPLWGALACKAGQGDRCICADDCRDGLVCLAGGRVLAADACSSAIGPGAEPGTCVDSGSAGEGDEGVPEPEIYLDLGSKRDFEPGVPPEATSSGDSGTATSDDPLTSTTTTATTSTSSGSESGATDSGSTGAATETGTDTGSSGTGSESSESGG